MRHTLIALIRNPPDTVARAVGLLRRRGFRLESLAVGPSEPEGLSRVTLVVEAENVSQMLRQLERLADVVSVHDLTGEPGMTREVARFIDSIGRLPVPDLRGSGAAALPQHRDRVQQPSRAEPGAATPYQWQADGAGHHEAI